MTPTLTIKGLDFETGQLTVTITGILLTTGHMIETTCRVPACTRTVTVDHVGHVDAWALAPSELEMITYWWEPIDGDAFDRRSDICFDADGWTYQPKKVANRHDLIFELPLTEDGDPLALQVLAELGKSATPAQGGAA